jgi:hypothetical protein
LAAAVLAALLIQQAPAATTAFSVQSQRLAAVAVAARHQKQVNLAARVVAVAGPLAAVAQRPQAGKVSLAQDPVATQAVAVAAQEKQAALMVLATAVMAYQTAFLELPRSMLAAAVLAVRVHHLPAATAVEVMAPTI